MEKVSVKLVVFKHPEPEKWDIYASYCPATCNFCAFGRSVQEVVEKFKIRLHRDLQNRLAYKNLEIWGWKITENSAKPPIFADEEAISLTEKLYEVKLIEPQIIEVNVELPKAEKTI